MKIKLTKKLEQIAIQCFVLDLRIHSSYILWNLHVYKCQCYFSPPYSIDDWSLSRRYHHSAPTPAPDSFHALRRPLRAWWRCSSTRHIHTPFYRRETSIYPRNFDRTGWYLLSGFWVSVLMPILRTFLLYKSFFYSDVGGPGLCLTCRPKRVRSSPRFIPAIYPCDLSPRSFPAIYPCDLSPRSIPAIYSCDLSPRFIRAIYPRDFVARFFPAIFLRDLSPRFFPVIYPRDLSPRFFPAIFPRNFPHNFFP